jgi:hypothetical protein
MATPQPETKKRPSIILIAIAGIIGLCVICAVFGAAMNAMGLVPTRTPSIIPTDTLPPGPTDTPAPTDTPVPSERPVPASTVDLYYSEMLDRIDAYQSAYDKFSVQHLKISDNPNVVKDIGWKLDMGSALGQLQVAAEDLQTIPNKTSRYEKLDAIFQLLGSETLEMIKNYTTAVDNVDATYLEKAKANLLSMNEYIQQATDELAILKSSP